MKFVCDSCRSRYEIADEKVAGKTLQIRCRNCGHLIRLSAPALAAAPSVGNALGNDAAAVAWHYSINGEVFGPYSEDELVDRFQDGRLGDEAYVWQALFAEWKPAIEVPVFSSAIAVGRRSQLRQRAPKTVQLEASDLAGFMAAAQPSPSPSLEPLPARRATLAHAPITAAAPTEIDTTRDQPLPSRSTAAEAFPLAESEANARDSLPRPMRRRASVAMPVAFDELRERIASGNRPATETPSGASVAAALDAPAPAEQTGPSTPVSENVSTVAPSAAEPRDTPAAEPGAAARLTADELPTSALPAPENRSAGPEDLRQATASNVPARPRTASASVGAVPPPKPMGARAPTGSPPAVPQSVNVPARTPATTPAHLPEVAPAATDSVTEAPVAEAPVSKAPVAEAPDAQETSAPDATAPPTPTSTEDEPAPDRGETRAQTPPAASADATPSARRATSASKAPGTEDDALVDSWLGQSGGPRTVTSASYAVPTIPLPAVQRKKTSPLVWASAFIVLAAVVGAGVIFLAPDTTISTPSPAVVAAVQEGDAAAAAPGEASAVAEASATPVAPSAPPSADLLVRVRAQRAVGAAVLAAHTAALSSAGLPPEAIAELQRRQQIQQNTPPAFAQVNGAANDRGPSADTPDNANQGTGQSVGSSFANMRNTQQVAISAGQGGQRNDGPGREHFAAGLSGFVANAFRRCVQRHLVDEGSLPNAARVVVEITVQPDGDVSGIRLDDALRGTTFGDCMQGNSQNWRFPPFDGAATTLQRTYIIE